jgi:long-chain acyl-CoA synthetase
MNVANLLHRAGRVAPDQSALVRGEQTVATYGKLAASASAIATSLTHKFGLVCGDRVALIMQNCPEFIECLFGCWYAGVTVVPINHRLHPREVAYIIEDSGSKLLFTTPDLASNVSDALSLTCGTKPEVIETSGIDYHRLTQGYLRLPQEVPAEQCAWLFYTSGTTGRPKGAMLSNRNLLAMTTAYFADVDNISTRDCILHAAPMSHGSGMYILPHVAAMAAQVVPISYKFEPDEILALMARHDGMTLFLAPTMLQRLVGVARDREPAVSSLKTIICGGGPLYIQDCKTALEFFGPKIGQIYGQGECPMTITTLPKRIYADTNHPRYEQRLGSVGFAHAVVDVRVASPDNDSCPVGEIGEVLVRGDPVMLGYWRNALATAEALRDGWLHTGDLGSMDCDGFLTLKSRIKELIISGGSNIYPREVEEVLLLHPAIAEVAVVGQSHREMGEQVLAFIVCAQGANVSSSELDALCLENIARYKRPRAYRFVAKLPKNSQGKVLKTELRNMVENPTAASGEPI